MFKNILLIISLLIFMFLIQPLGTAIALKKEQELDILNSAANATANAINSTEIKHEIELEAIWKYCQANTQKEELGVNPVQELVDNGLVNSSHSGKTCTEIVSELAFNRALDQLRLENNK